MNIDIKKGDVFKTNNSGLLVIDEVNEFGIYFVTFIDTGFTCHTRKQQLLKGMVKDKTLVKDRSPKKKFKVELRDGRELIVNKLTDVLEHIEDKSKQRLYRVSCGLVVNNHEVVNIERIHV